MLYLLVLFLKLAVSGIYYPRLSSENSEFILVISIINSIINSFHIFIKVAVVEIFIVAIIAYRVIVSITFFQFEWLRFVS